MANLLKRGVLAIAGMVVTLVWWSIRPGHDTTASADRIPDTVWNGGGGALTIETESSCPATIRVSFSEEAGEERSLETWEKIPADKRTWTIDVPPNTGGYIDLGAEAPKVGDRLRWTLKVNGDVVDEQAETLEEELKSGYAFGLVAFFDDYGTAELGED